MDEQAAAHTQPDTAGHTWPESPGRSQTPTADDRAVLAAFGIWGWLHATVGWRFVLVVALPLAFAVAWGYLAAPNSSTQLPDPYLLVFQALAFLLGTVALATSGRLPFGIVLGLVAVAVLSLDRVLA